MQNHTNEKIDLLTKNILEQAKFYLEDADEFFPFGAVIDKNKLLKPVSLYSEKEKPNSQLMSSELESLLKKGIKESNYLMAAIATDVFINITSSNNKIEKKSAVQVKYCSTDEESTQYYLYQKEQSGYVFELNNGY